MPRRKKPKEPETLTVMGHTLTREDGVALYSCKLAPKGVVGTTCVFLEVACYVDGFAERPWVPRIYLPRMLQFPRILYESHDTPEEAAAALDRNLRQFVDALAGAAQAT